MIREVLAQYPVVGFTFRLYGSLFFIGAALGFLGAAIVMVYEVFALWTRVVPTISLITAFEFLKHPVWWVVLACLLSFSFGALVTHFTHWTP